METLAEVLHVAAVEKNKMLEHLKAMSPRYPQFIVSGKGNIEKGMEMLFSSLVKFEYDGKTYLRHHVEMYFFRAGETPKDIAMLWNMFEHSCKMTIAHGVPVNVTTSFGLIKDDELIEEVENA